MTAQAVEIVADTIAKAMRQGEYGEYLWQEIERMLRSERTEDRDAIEDSSLSDVIKRAAMVRATSRIEQANVDTIAAHLALRDDEAAAQRGQSHG